MSMTMNKRKQEMVRVNDELIVSRRLYGVLEKLAAHGGFYDIPDLLEQELTASIRMARDEFAEYLRRERRLARAVDLAKSGAFQNGGAEAAGMNIEVDPYTLARIQKAASDAGCGLDTMANAIAAVYCDEIQSA